jgi:hypothetical protein
MATTEARTEPNIATLTVDGYVDATNEAGKEFEEILGGIVEEHSYAGYPMAVFGEWLAANRPGATLNFGADALGALHVTITL